MNYYLCIPTPPPILDGEGGNNHLKSSQIYKSYKHISSVMNLQFWVQFCGVSQESLARTVGLKLGNVKADLHGTIFAYDCRMRFL